MIDIDNKSFEELHNIELEIANRKELMRQSEIEEFNQLVELVKAKAEILNINPAKLFRNKNKVMYVDPDNANNTWGGNGPIPKWLMSKIGSDVPKDQRKEAIKPYMVV